MTILWAAFLLNPLMPPILPIKIRHHNIWLLGHRVPAKSTVSWKLKIGDFTWYKVEVTDIKFNEFELRRLLLLDSFTGFPHESIPFFF